MIDPAVGQSFHQIAMRGRSLHRSQDMGQLQGIGPSPVRLRLAEDRTRSGGEALFAGVDTTLEGAWLVGEPDQRREYVDAIRRYIRLADSARNARRDGATQAPILLAARSALMLASNNRPMPMWRVSDPVGEQFDRLQEMIQRAEGLVFDAVVDDDRVAPGQTVTATVSAWNAGKDTLELSGGPVFPHLGISTDEAQLYERLASHVLWTDAALRAAPAILAAQHARPVRPLGARRLRRPADPDRARGRGRRPVRWCARCCARRSTGG